MAAPPPKSSFFLVSLLLLYIHSSSSALSFDSIYQFGDSLSDTGNAIRESSFLGCSGRPYGVSISGDSAGRCSDGLLIVDFFARALKLPLLSPYLKKDADFSHGVNFAVAGATALNSSAFGTFDNSLSSQLEWFKTHLKSACTSSSDCKQKFQNTLFLMGEIGGNDYNFPLGNGRSPKELESLVPSVVQVISDGAQVVIDHGAVHVVVPGNFPIGCMPTYLDSYGSNDPTMYDDLGCLKSFNDFAELHNDQLRSALQDLRKQNPSVTIYYGDYYSAFKWVLRNATSLGFEKDEALKPCCGSGGGCGAGICSDPKKRISWDGLHLTQEAYRYIAQWLFSNTFPETIPCCSEPSPSTTTSTSSGAAVDFPVLIRYAVLSSLGVWAIGGNTKGII